MDRYCGGGAEATFLQPQNKCDFVLWGKSYANGTSSPPGTVDIALDTGRTFSFKVNFNKGGQNNLAIDNIQCDCSFVTCHINIDSDAGGNCTITVSIYSTTRNTFPSNPPPPEILFPNGGAGYLTKFLYTIVNNKINK
jgi:hypothetical protein